MSRAAAATCPSIGVSSGSAEDTSHGTEGLRRVHVFAAVLCATVFSVDLVEIALGPAFAAIFSAPPHRLGGAALTALLCSVYAGAVVGAPTLGWIADTRGLRTSLVISTLWLSVSSLGAAASGSTTSLIAWRMLSGIALGGLPPLIIAYLTDFTPRHLRGRVIFFMCAAAYLAPPATIFYLRGHEMHPAFGLEAWRWPLLTGSAICMAAGLLLMSLPEAPHWLAATGRVEELQRVRARVSRSRLVWAIPRHSTNLPVDTLIAARGSARGNLIMLSAISFTLAAATVSFPLVTGPILLARHVNVTDALLYIGLANFGPVIATFSTGLVVDRLPRRSVMWLCAAMMLVSSIAFVLNGPRVVVAGSLILFAVATSLYMPTLTAFGAELFRPAVRARATSIAWLANRTAGVVVPAVLIPLSHSGSVVWVGIVLCLTLTANLALLTIPKTQPGTSIAGQKRRILKPATR